MEIKSILDVLCSHYMEECSADSPTVKRLFSELNSCTASLPFKAQDNIVTITCKLCGEHEHRAYAAGFTDAFQLIFGIWGRIMQNE